MLYTQETKLAARFVAEDFCFVRSILTPTSARAGSALGRLWDDPEALREILDLKEILRSLLDSPGALRVSPAFYFYVLVRHAFLDAGIEDAGVADYVAEVLVEKLEAAPDDPMRSLASGYTRAAEFISILHQTQGRLRFHLQVAAGDQFTVLAGLYPGFLQRRAERHGAPDIAFYDAFAQRIYRDAADNPDAPEDAPKHSFGLLSEVFPAARRCLNRVAEEYVFLGD
jgi:hypothetical protein